MSSGAPKTFNLLSIGQRGVGKTVFLAGSYAELYNQSERELWFDCQEQTQEKLDSVSRYVARTGLYPPLTVKITDFKFSVKQRRQDQTQTLCYFQWWDIPGEICHVHNAEFTKLVSNSHGCCVFIDANALVHDNYQDQDITSSVVAIANVVNLNRLNYAFALILTKCDLLKSDSRSQQLIDTGLQPLTRRLEAVNANYQTFYSAIPIVEEKGTSSLKATGAVAPLLWLVSELAKIYTEVSLLHSEDGLAKNLQESDRALKARKKVNRSLVAAIVLALALAGVVNFWVDYRNLFQAGTYTLTAEELKQIKLRLQLAQLYKTAAQFDQAEALYDEVLIEQENNLNALVNKAVLRYHQNDRQTAETLFEQAELAAPKNLKTEVRKLSQQVLQDRWDTSQPINLGL